MDYSLDFLGGSFRLFLSLVGSGAYRGALRAFDELRAVGLGFKEVAFLGLQGRARERCRQVLTLSLWGLVAGYGGLASGPEEGLFEAI